MKVRIKHESRGRMRIQLLQNRMTLEQADLLEAWLLSLDCVSRATVHERTCCAVICYQGERAAVIRALSRFSWDDPDARALSASKSGRELNRIYEERLVGMVLGRVLNRLLLPAPLRMCRICCRSVPFLFRAMGCLVRRRLQVELLDGLSIGISMLRGDFSTASSVMFLLQVGELLEEWTRKKSVDDLARSMALNVDRVWRRTHEGEELVPMHRIRSGDSIIVRMGGMIPLDCVVEEGEVMVNQASLTGESVPVAKRPGTTVYAGTVVEEGECVLRVEQLSGESRYDKIVAMIEASEKLKSGVESRAANLADKLVPYTLAGSALTWLVTRNVTRAASLLMVDFSCALKLSMPLAVLSAMREASRYHVTVKGGRFLEAMAEADLMVFDKTGTLTHACPVVERVVPFDGNSEAEMLRMAACLEEHFPHSMANAVVRAAQERGLSHEEMHSEVEYLVAHGIASKVGEKRVIIGSAHFVFEDEGCAVSPEDQGRYDALPPECSQLYLAIDGRLAAVICISDPLREEAGAVLNSLRRLGIEKTVMLTGDSNRTAVAIAAQVGVDEYCAEVLPADKARYVEEAKTAGHKVIMVGDGINDSPALSAADVGIAISDGAAIAREIADITIAADNLFELVSLRMISTSLMRRIRSNYRFVIGFNGGLIALGALGLIQPTQSALFHNLSTLAISLRSMTRLVEPRKMDWPVT